MHTIYELTEAERITMKKLIDMGLVVTIGEHASSQCAEWDGTLRLESDAVLNGVAFKAGTRLHFSTADARK